MKYILIANSDQPCYNISIIGVSGTRYYFAQINTLQDAYNHRAALYEDILWVKFPDHLEAMDYMARRIRPDTTS